MSIKPTWQGELQFRRYSDTSTQGQQVVFAVEDRDALAPFIGKEGRRFMAVLVELGDDEMPVQEPEKVKVGPLCREAVGLCQMPEFWAWINSRNGLQADSAAGAAAFIRTICQIESRKELDTSAYAGNLFVNDVRLPFMRWMKARSK